MKNKKVLVIIVIALVLTILLGSSYAYLRVEKKSGEQNISIANFGLVIKEDMKEITLDKQVPKTDEEGLKNTPNTFKIENQGDVTAKYRLSLIDGKVASTMSNLDVRYQLKRIRSSGSETLEVKSLGADGLFDEGVIAPNEEISFELILWIDYDANPNGLKYNKVLSLEGFQADTLDTSGANPPEMLSNMIPVYYDKKSDTDGVWKVADITNRDQSHKWYDYNDFMWANAVTVKESNGTLNDDGSMTFDGVDDYYDLGYENYKFGNAISLVIRVKIIEEDKTQEFFGNWESAGGGFAYNKDKSFYFCEYIEENGYVGAVSQSMYNYNEWYTLVGTYDNEYIRLYIDGVEVAKSQKVVGNIKASIPSIILGGNPNPSSDLEEIVNIGNPSKSTISDAFIYDDALTADEVSKYFKGEITDYPKDNLLVAKTEFNELDTRQKYLEASAGTEVKMDDISSMWVWIPRYKYTIFNGNNETVNEQMINVQFEQGINSTGTVSCHDEILTADDSASSEECTDETNNGIKNGVSTYTHPAFTFGSEELVGFWFAKFEMSTDNQECLSNQDTSCDKKLNIYVKPNNTSLRYQDTINKFISIRNMETYNNIHGFYQNKNGTIVNLNGEITNDNNNYDTHMVKNMEWGAVAYLSQSKYGKQGNNLYSGKYKEVYINNYQEINNNIFTYKTGFSGKNYNASKDSEKVLYNNLKIEVEGQGYIGAGASTTGTIYGIYDMNGGAFDDVMAWLADKNGKFMSYESWKDNDIPLSRYYDLYSYSTNIINKTRGKLGDATKEIIVDFSNILGGWNNDTTALLYSEIYSINRSGIANDSDNAGIFYFGYTTPQRSIQSHTTRPVLTISRDFPWKDN